MSAPSFIVAFKDGIIVSTTSHNWGWVSPSHYEIAIRIIKIVSHNYYEAAGLFAKDWDYLRDRYYGKMTRENYELMYAEAKRVNDGEISKKDFSVEPYFEAVK